MSEEYKRDSFIFYGSIRDATRDIDDPMIRLEIYEAVIDYSLYKIEPSDISSMAMVVFKLLKPNLDTQRANSENGKKGGLMKKKKPASENSESPLAEIPKARLQKSKKPASESLESPLSENEKARLQETEKPASEISESYRYKDKDKDRDRYRDGDKDKDKDSADAFDFDLPFPTAAVKEAEKEIMSYYHKVTGKSKRINESTAICIRGWLAEGYSVSDFKRVIDNMYAAWKGKVYETGLRPEKLFGSSFEQYLDWNISETDSKTDNADSDGTIYDVNDLEQYILRNTVKADD